MAGLVLARFEDPVTAQQIVGMITGMRVEYGRIVRHRAHFFALFFLKTHFEIIISTYSLHLRNGCSHDKSGF